MAAMAVIEGCLDVAVYKWKVKADASDLFGGLFKINLFSPKSDTEWWESGRESFARKKIFFPKSSLQHLNFFRKAGDLLHAVLREYPGIGCCGEDLDSFATSVAAYLCCKYHFSPEILSGQGPYKPVIFINLLVTTFQEQTSPPHSPTDAGDDLDDQLNKLIILEDDAKLVKAAIGNCYIAAKSPMEDIEEVKGGLVMRAAVAVAASDDDDDDDSGSQLNCPICLESLEKNASFAQASCSHVFHQGCIISWLLRNDSCPICRSACSVLV